MVEMGRKAVHVVIAGRVQGVWFRGWTVEQAGARGLDGWVRNRADGSLEAVFAGEAGAVDAMVAACRMGPEHAEVRGVEIEPAEPINTPGFGIRR